MMDVRWLVLSFFVVEAHATVSDNDLRQLYSVKERVLNERRARNVIFVVGDGMGISTLTAARIFKAQVRGEHGRGEEGALGFEQFPNAALLKTYSSDRVVTDSAASASAYFCGKKTKNDVFGFDEQALVNKSCGFADSGRRLVTLFDLAQALGKATGIVTTTRLTHATPAAAYAASVQRDWEDDSQVPIDERACQKDIARQLVEDLPGRDIDVLLGGGLRHFQSKEIGGHRTDGRDLVERWRKANAERGGAFVRNRRELLEEVPQRRRLLGLFAQSHLAFVVDRPEQRVNVSQFRVEMDDPERFEEPTLAEMVRAAVQVLKQDEDGFVLVVEGGRIDHAHHEVRSGKALHETLEVERAVETAMSGVNTSETLVIVTADHSHVFTIAGYQERDTSLLGLAKLANDKVADGRYLTLGYTNGPNPLTTPHQDPLRVGDPISDKDYRQQSGFNISSETHAGEDVAVYARGPWSHLFQTLHDNTYPFYALAYAACLPIPANRYATQSWEKQRSRRADGSTHVKWQKIALALDPRKLAHCSGSNGGRATADALSVSAGSRRIVLAQSLIVVLFAAVFLSRG